MQWTPDSAPPGGLPAPPLPPAPDEVPSAPFLGNDPDPVADCTPAGSSGRKPLSKLTGELQFVAPVLHAGSTYLRGFYDALHAMSLDEHLRPGNDYSCAVPLPGGFWVDFDYYKRLLLSHTGTRVLRGDWVTLARQWTDASSSGTGYMHLGRDERGLPLTELQVMAGVWPRHLQMQSSNWRELRTILYTLQQAHKKQEATGHRALDGTVLYAFTDNAVSASSINKGTSKSPALMRLVRGLREFEALLGCHVVSVWISGKAIIEQGTDDLSRGVHDKGALAPDAPAPLTFSPIDQACPAPEAALVANVVASFPVPAVHLTTPADWADAPHPGRPVVITPPTSLARSAIDQVLRWSAARPYTTGVALILPNDYASSWGRLSRYFTRVYFARAGMLGRPDDAVGAMAVLYLLPHLDQSHDQVQFAAAPPTGDPLPSLSRYRLHLDPEVRCMPGDRHHPLTSVLRALGIPAPPQLPQELLQQLLPDTVHLRALRRPASLPLPACPAVRLVPPAAALLETFIFQHLVRRDADVARGVIHRHVPRRQRAPWLRAINRVLGDLRAYSPVTASSPEARASVIFFRLPYYLWSDFAFGVVPALASPPPRFVHKNYDTATHQTVYDEIARLRRRRYASGPYSKDDADNVHVVMPLGAVPKKDTPEPRVVVDGTACGLNDACSFLKFKYPSFMDVVGLAYPGCFYSKLDWKDAFFSVPLYPPFRRFFCFEHPESGEYFHYDVLPFGFKLSPLYYSRLVHAYVDYLRMTPRFNGELVCNNTNSPVHHRALPLLYRRRPSGEVATGIEQYCDDGMLFSPSKESADPALRQASAVVSHVGAIPKTSKTVHPVQSGEHILGLSLDTRNNAIRIGIPPDRLTALRSSMAEFERCYRQ